jgi:hypothetical protein
MDDDGGGASRSPSLVSSAPPPPKNANQTMWVLLLKAHYAARGLASLASAAIELGGAARHMVAAGRTNA